jgi:hypothetical protein
MQPNGRPGEDPAHASFVTLLSAQLFERARFATLAAPHGAVVDGAAGV